ncbi:hypothetical protein EVAR_96291_1 [Eumeta japonica]|uniref:Histone H2A n=1 Tax=Eumeta variegata TaxID=151549 RepID=A0A4C1VW92_EUMVA|nr:hypothetical protein EVAR_96291_1 [Eumeta japonica]
MGKTKRKVTANNDEKPATVHVSKKKTVKKTRRNLSKIAGLIFPITRVKNLLKIGNYAKWVSMKSAIYLTAALEYIVAETLEISAVWALNNKRSRITPRHLTLAVRDDMDFRIFLRDKVISQGGVFPHIEKVLLPKNVTKIVENGAASSQEY